MKTTLTEPPPVEKTVCREKIEAVRPDREHERPEDQVKASIALASEPLADENAAPTLDEDLSPETLLQRLLMTSERLAHRAELGRRRWQLARPHAYFRANNPQWPETAELSISVPPVFEARDRVEDLRKAVGHELQRLRGACH